jgi:hypothetical protein
LYHLDFVLNDFSVVKIQFALWERGLVLYSKICIPHPNSCTSKEEEEEEEEEEEHGLLHGIGHS